MVAGNAPSPLRLRTVFISDVHLVLYCNDGDWVESCSALAEDLSGRLRLIDWPKLKAQICAPPLALPVGQAA
jgi:hypothetical protein